MRSSPSSPSPTTLRLSGRAWDDEHNAARRPPRRPRPVPRARTTSSGPTSSASPSPSPTSARTFAMLGFGIRHRDRRQVTGEPAAHRRRPWFGDEALPARQHRRARMSAPSRPMDIPADLQAILTNSIGDVMNTTVAHTSTNTRALGWGVAVGTAQAVTTLAFWWVELSTVHALMIALIAAVYVGFAVSDGRTHVIAVECAVVVAFFVTAAAAVSVTPWILVRDLPRPWRQGPVAAPAPRSSTGPAGGRRSASPSTSPSPGSSPLRSFWASTCTDAASPQPTNPHAAALAATTDDALPTIASPS